MCRADRASYWNYRTASFAADEVAGLPNTSKRSFCQQSSILFTTINRSGGNRQPLTPVSIRRLQFVVSHRQSVAPVFSTLATIGGPMSSRWHERRNSTIGPDPPGSPNRLISQPQDECARRLIVSFLNVLLPLFAELGLASFPRSAALR